MNDVQLGLPKKLVSSLKEHSAHIKTLRMTVGLLSLALALSLGALYKAMDDITIYIPPDLSDGAAMKSGDVPKGTVLTNAAYLWTEFNTWMKDGNKDAFSNLTAYQNYFGSDFRQQMRDQYNDLFKKGDLNRIRRLTLAPGTLSEFDNRVITKVRGKSWVVLLDVIVEDFYLGEPLQKLQVRYPLVVERVNTTADQNPIGMMIVGLNGSPKVIKDKS